MEWIIAIIIVLIIYYSISSKKKKQEYEIPIEVTFKASTRSRDSDSERTVDTGKVKKVSETSYCVNPKSPLPLTLSGLSNAEAKEIKKLLDGEAQWQRNISDITFLFAQNNIECIELEEFINKIRNEASRYIEERKNSSEEWKHSSEKDKDDLTVEFQSASLERLTTKPSNDWSLKTLIFSAPGDITSDDELLGVFSGKRGIYRFYVSNLGRSNKANQVAADDYNRKQWETLVDLGLAKRGKDIPIKVLLEGLRMKDINEYFSDRLDKKLSRKAKAVEFALSQADVLDVLSRHMSFREMFQIVEPEGLNISSIKECYEYAAAYSEIIRDTYVSGYRTLDTLEDAREADYDGWEIEAEDCCQACSTYNGKRSKRKPTKLPPFHIGCTCSLEGTYDDY